MKPFRPQVFLFRMLATIFAVEAGFLAFAFYQCSRPIPGQVAPMVSERCPDLGERAETLFVAAVATTLSLLGGSAVSYPSSSSGDRDALASQPPQPLPQPSPESSSEASQPAQVQEQRPERGERKT